MLYSSTSLIPAFLLVCLAPLTIRTIYTIDNGLPNNEVRVVFKGNGPIWVGTRQGVARFENAVLSMVQSESNPQTQAVSAIFQDSKGNMWFGGVGEVHRFDGTTHQSYSMSGDMQLGGRVIFSFHEDDDQNIWATSAGGAVLFDGQKWNPFNSVAELKDQIIHDIDQDATGKFWFATRRGGLNLFDGENWEYHFPDKNCRSIHKDRQGSMWIGTSDGIIFFDGNEWKVFREGNTVLPMFEGIKGYIWCIANGIDILRISPEGDTTHYPDVTNGMANEIYDLAYDDQGAIWAGTDQGVYVLR